MFLRLLRITRLILALGIPIILMSSCSSHSFKMSLDEFKDMRIYEERPHNTDPEKLRQENIRLASDLRLLTRLSGELESMKLEMFKLKDNSRVWKIGYFPPEEHDKLENILFRYLMIRNTLWELINYYKDFRTNFTTPETQTKGFLTGYSAGLHLSSYTSLMITTFMNEATEKKLNEAYPRSGIESGSFDMLLNSLTSIDHMDAVKVAWILFKNEKDDRHSLLRKICKNKTYRNMADQIEKFYKETDDRLTYILKKKSQLFPKTVNRLRHSAIAGLAGDFNNSLEDNLYAIRGSLFRNVGHIKISPARPLKFSDRQKKKIHSMLQPGDIILTYASGYMSNVFLPGNFKHGIIYIGNCDQRKKVGLVNDPTGLIKGINTRKLEKDFLSDNTDTGKPADVIEAVAEGVILNSLDFLMDTHINRMVVLRPKLSERERKEALTIVFAMLGNEYDFRFDFNDGSYQCCTEIIYRSLNSRGAYNFELVKRMGNPTLSADDIITYYKNREYKAFDTVFYVQKDDLADDNRAKIFEGDEGLEQLKKLMQLN